MAKILFYEKPGCRNNTSQKAMLGQAGHEVIARNILTEPWTAPRLKGFLAGLPVAGWFNFAAPRIKSGEVIPDALDEDTAIDLMLADPLLIRRPLMECEGRRMAGFDLQQVQAWLGTPLATNARSDLQNCPRKHASATCSMPSKITNRQETSK